MLISDSIKATFSSTSRKRFRSADSISMPSTRALRTTARIHRRRHRPSPVQRNCRRLIRIGSPLEDVHHLAEHQPQPAHQTPRTIYQHSAIWRCEKRLWPREATHLERGKCLKHGFTMLSCCFIFPIEPAQLPGIRVGQLLPRRYCQHQKHQKNQRNCRHHQPQTHADAE